MRFVHDFPNKHTFSNFVYFLRVCCDATLYIGFGVPGAITRTLSRKNICLITYLIIMRLLESCVINDYRIFITQN